MLRHSPSISAALSSALLLLAVVSASSQIVTNREPAGPSSRKTGLVITEIMYNPRPIPGFPTNQTREFIEVFNSNPWDEDISGFFIDGAVRYTFPPGTVLNAGAYLAVARVPNYIRTNYSITNVFGPWDGATSNRLSTETAVVRLRNRLGAVLLSVEYHDSPPWPEGADGAGHSIVLARPSLGENTPEAWAESDVVGGSPGRADDVPAEPLENIFINEWQNHSDPEDFIELYNCSNVPVDMSGAWLSDDPATNKFRIPNGTFIPPRGFLVYSQNTLGFELFAGGETILLWNSNLTRVIDIIDFRGASNNVAQGRWPDAGPYVYGMAPNTPGAPNSTPRRYAVVINEIMYNPISGNTDEEFIEIHNRGNTPVNLAGWEFVAGISFAFPTNASTANMPPGAHWVVARNPGNLFTIYPNLNSNNTFGPYTGTLANGGERLVLAAADYDVVTRSNVMVNERLNVVVSDVTYGDGGKWGHWSDGQGSSLELIDPEANDRLSANWADSYNGNASQWTAIEYNGPLGESLGTPVNDSLIIMLQGIGECLVDEVEVRVDNGPNLVANGGFESGLNGWTLQGSHDFSTIENVAFVGTKSLHVRAGSRGDNQANRILSAQFTSAVPDTAKNISIRAKVRWLRGHPEVLLRLHGSATEAYGRMALPRRLGTPGQVNSTKIANAGPAVYDVKHTPVLPAVNEPVVVTARVSDRQGISSLAVWYRLDPSFDQNPVIMVDDGTSGDAVAGDGVFSATIPGQGAGQMVAWYIEAVDGLAAFATFPRDVYPQAGFDRCWPVDAISRECLVRWGEVQMPGDFASYHLWVSSVNSNLWHHRAPQNNTPIDGTFIYNNSRVVYNALPLFSGSPFHRTNSTAGPAGPLRVDYVMNFPEDEPLLGSRDFVLNNPGNPDRFTVSDLSAINERTAYKIFEGMGLPFNNRRFIHFFVNGSQRSTCYERSGNFIFEDSQQPNGDMIEQWFPDDSVGQLFKVEDWFEFERDGFNVNAYNDADLARRTTMINGRPTFMPGTYRFQFRKRSVNVGNSANDFAPIYALIDAVSPASNPTNNVIDVDAFSAVADWETWMRHFATQRAVGNFDTYGWERGKNDYLYFGATNGSVHMPWDVDYALGLGKPANEPLFASNDPRVLAMFNTPAILRAYWRAFNDLVNGPLNNAVLDPFMDARVQALTNNNINIDLDAVAVIKSYIAARRAYLQSQLATVAVPFAIHGPASFSTSDNLLFITGTAPVGVKTITLNGLTYPMTWTTATSFQVRVVLHAGLNTFTLNGYDRFGTAVPGATATLNATFTGAEPDPLSALTLSEIMFATSNSAQFVEIVNRSVDAFDLSGWRVDGAGVTFPLGSIVTNHQTIVLARNAATFRSLYPGVPVFASYTANLSATQTLALVRTNGALGHVVDAFRYEPNAPWITPATGQTLQLIDLAQENSRACNWTAGAPTPGTTNSVAATLAAIPPLWLNEVQIASVSTGVTDNFGEPSPWIELFNAGSNALNLTGCFLADNLSSNLTQWQFPAGATLASGERKIIWADGQPQQSTATEWHTSFALGVNGTVALVRLTNGLPQIFDHLVWRWLCANVSYGSFPEGQPVYRFTLSGATPAGANTGRAVPITINEFLASNSTGFGDPADSDKDDWFELFNGGNDTIDLGGFYLTDSAATPTKYRVPTNSQYRIPPGGFLLVWADDEASQNRADRPDLHVNFKLASASGFVGLFAPDGVTLVDSNVYLTQTTDVSEGRYGDGAAQRYSMPRPTPKAPNGIPSYNSPPRMPYVTNVVVTNGQSYIVSVRATDPDAQTITYTTNAASAQPGASLFQTGVWRWLVPANHPAGDYPITITATDNGTPPMSDSATFIVTVRAPSASPATTNVLVAGPRIYAVASTGGQATFTIETIPGRTYRVFYKDELGAANWTQLDQDFVASNSSASLTDAVPQPQRFYRVLQVD